MTRRPRDARFALILAAILAATYAVLGFMVFAPEGVYSGDVGVKFVQARAAATHHFRSLDLPYPGEFIDPAREFFPLRPPFTIKVREETQAIFSPAAAVLQGFFAAAGGIRGLILLSILSAAGVLVASAAMAPTGYKMPAVAAVGVASPLWSYATLGWEHAPAVALSTAAFAVAVSSTSLAALATAGLCIGAGALLRDEVLLLTPGLLLLVWTTDRSKRAVMTTLFAVAMVVLIGAAAEWLVFGRPPAAHLRHAVTVTSSLEPADSLSEGVPVLTQLTLKERYQTVIQYWLLGYGNTLLIVTYVTSLCAALLVRWRSRHSLAALPLALWIAGVVALAVIDLWEVISAPKWVAGLHRVSPYLVFAFLPAPDTDADRKGSMLVRTILLATVVFIVVSFVTTNTTGGKSLGPRLLLPLLPLLAIAALFRIGSYLRQRGTIERTIGWAGVSLAIVAAGIHLAGTIPAYYHRNRADAAAVILAAAEPARIVVADDPYTAQLLFPLYYRKIIFLADSGEARARLGARLAELGAPDVLLMSRRPEPGMRLSPLRLRQSDTVGRMIVQYWGRVGRVID